MEFNAMEASAKECLAYYQAKLDEEAWEAKKNGKLVCWSASVAPPEFCVAMDIAMVYPETHAAGAGASLLVSFCSSSRILCSYGYRYGLS